MAAPRRQRRRRAGHGDPRGRRGLRATANRNRSPLGEPQPECGRELVGAGSEPPRRAQRSGGAVAAARLRRRRGGMGPITQGPLAARGGDLAGRLPNMVATQDHRRYRRAAGVVSFSDTGSRGRDCGAVAAGPAGSERPRDPHRAVRPHVASRVTMTSEPVVYIGGRFVPASEARLSIYDFGIVLGATVTDLLRTFRRQPYRMDDHIRRFCDSCKYARIEVPLPPDEIATITQELVRRNAALLAPEQELAVVYFITPGENLVYAGATASTAPLLPTFCIHSFPLPFSLWRRFFTEGVHLVIPATRHVPPQCVDPKVKNRSRLHWWLAEQEGRLADPAAMPLLLDLDGNLTETSGANILFVKNGAVLSPAPRN